MDLEGDEGERGNCKWRLHTKKKPALARKANGGIFSTPSANQPEPAIKRQIGPISYTPAFSGGTSRLQSMPPSSP